MELMIKECKTLLYALFVLSALLLSLPQIQADGADPLPSWNEGAAKKAIIEFVNATTQVGNVSFIPIKDRVATFDEDGTLWVEQPLYVEFIYSIESVKTLSPMHPEWVKTQPFKTILSGDQTAINNLSIDDLKKVVLATQSGMTIDEFHTMVGNWLKKAIHPRYKRPYTKLVYQPMLEVMQLLRRHQFNIYIVSGAGQEFIRVSSEKLYGVAEGHVIGTPHKVKYEYRGGYPVLLLEPEAMFIDVKTGKPEGINLIIGKRPVAAFGNSIGDREMLEWTQANTGRTLELLVHHDDAVREYDYGPNSKVGTFTDELMAEAKKQGWIVVSMKNDWKVMFPWQKN